MKFKPLAVSRFFFATQPLPCPYLPGKMERRVVMELYGRDVASLHDSLTQTGYRRSHGIAYAPVCADCQACVPVRIRVSDFAPSRSQRRVWAKNKGLISRLVPPAVTEEQYELFSIYLRTRHSGGEMEKMELHAYQALVEETPVDTQIAEFRNLDDDLVAACLLDVIGDGLSAVYSFFDPAIEGASPGTFMILWLIEEARRRGLPYVYLGYWIAESQKMAYKSTFQPMESFSPGGWHDLLTSGEGAAS